MFNKKPYCTKPKASPNENGSPWEPELLQKLKLKKWIDINITHAQYNSQFKILNDHNEIAQELRVEFSGQLQTQKQFVKTNIDFNGPLNDFVGEMWGDYQPDIDLHGTSVSIPILRIHLASDIKIINAIHDALQNRLQSGYKSSSLRLHVFDSTNDTGEEILSMTIEKLTIWSDLHAPDVESYARSVDTMHLADVRRGNYFRKSLASQR